ncbi:CFEM domain protein [Apiospora kogelbergensis]|uniref:CFEM domain protein n=1 Tax=Apiospora kogelbergensis TaxID=1337665 RepID=UPI00312F3CFE
MKFTLPATLLAVAVSAQSTSVSTSTTCAAANIVDACLDTTNGYLAQCTDNADYQCKCDKYTAIMTCFNNCPNDSRASSYANSKQLYCPRRPAAHRPPVSAPATTTTAANKVGAAATSASSSAVAKSTDAAKNGAAEMLANTSGLMLAVAAIIAAVL